MSKVQVLFFPVSCGWSLVRTIEAVRENRSKYSLAAEFEVNAEGDGAAEEIFDISNNPGRDQERFKMFGNKRSVSVGDIVVVDGVEYACMPCGWETV